MRNFLLEFCCPKPGVFGLKELQHLGVCLLIIVGSLFCWHSELLFERLLFGPASKSSN